VFVEGFITIPLLLYTPHKVVYTPHKVAVDLRLCATAVPCMQCRPSPRGSVAGDECGKVDIKQL
jgi:hypothetical protein